MDWLQAFMIAGSTIGACWYMHHEYARETREFRNEHNRETREFRNEYTKEMRDFHGRLCALEEKYIQMMERFLNKK